MTWILAVVVIGLMVAVSILFVIVRATGRSDTKSPGAESFLLARGTLRTNSVVSLLLSSSFGVNALLYAAWLGFSVGAWGLVIQAAWGVSFLLLSPYTDRVRSTNSLHDLLGERYGSATRIFAALCTLVGFTYLIGWELAIGRSSTLSLLNLTKELTPERAASATDLLMAGLVFGTLVYTIWDGMAAQALVDQILNLIKIVVIGVLTILLINRFLHLQDGHILSAMFPSLNTMKNNLGVLGLVTNILFNLAWQFVNNSSWQSVIAGADADKRQSAQNLRMSGLVVFLTIGLLGTLFGVSLAGVPGVTPDNILTQAVGLLPRYHNFMMVAMLLLIASCIMSLLDGLFLSSTFTLTMDLLTPPEAGPSAEGSSSTRTLPAVRLSLLVIAICATWGVEFVFRITGANLFDFVYIVIITQLALFGPVIMALASRKTNRGPMWLPIIAALVFGFGSVALGTILHQQFLVNGAGAFTLMISFALAYLISVATVGRSHVG